VTGDNPTKVTCHNVKVAKKLTDKEKEWEVVRRKSGVNKDKVYTYIIYMSSYMYTIQTF